MNDAQRYRKIGLVLGALGLVVLLGGCGDEDDEPAGASPVEFSATTPEWPTLSAEDISVLKDSLTDPNATLVEVGATTAPVFPTNVPTPDVTRPEWIRLQEAVASTCEVAVAHGWSLHVVGRTDRTGSAERNEVLADDRARESARILADATCLEPAQITDEGTPAGDGPEGPNQADRRVEIAYIRPDPEGP